MWYEVLVLRSCLDRKNFTRSSLEKQHKTTLNARYLFNLNGKLVTTRLSETLVPRIFPIAKENY